MPLDPCPVDDPTLAEYALGPGRSRLDAAATDRVIAHLAVCPDCRQAYAAYLDRAQAPLPPEQLVHADGAPAEPWIHDSLRNVMTRVEARRRQALRQFAARRLLRLALCLLLPAVALGAAAMFWIDARRGAFPRTSPASNGAASGSNGQAAPILPVMAAETSSETRTDTGEMIRRAYAALKRKVDAVEPDAALALLEQSRCQALNASETVAAEWYPRLVDLHEQLVHRAAGTTAEGPALLALSRSYWLGGFQNEWLGGLQRYAEFAGETSRRTAAAKDEPPAERDRAAQRAKASAYFDEAKRCYEQKDYVAALRLCERLLAKYPSSAKAYEGQIVAARCHIALRQPDGAIACYQRIVEGCPDQRFARQAAETVLKFLPEANRKDEAIVQCRRLRQRFTDDDFRVFALFTEGRLLKDKGSEHYPEAITLLQSARSLRPDSPYARQAEEWIRMLRDRMFKQLLPPGPVGKG